MEWKNNNLRSPPPQATAANPSKFRHFPSFSVIFRHFPSFSVIFRHAHFSGMCRRSLWGGPIQGYSSQNFQIFFTICSHFPILTLSMAVSCEKMSTWCVVKPPCSFLGNMYDFFKFFKVFGSGSTFFTTRFELGQHSIFCDLYTQGCLKYHKFW